MICPDCSGYGWVCVTGIGEPGRDLLCDRCDGTGEVPFQKSCSCGTTYTQDQWRDLHYVGPQDNEDGTWLELRNCKCGNTLAIEREERPTDPIPKPVDWLGIAKDITDTYVREIKKELGWQPPPTAKIRVALDGSHDADWSLEPDEMK